jgi:hypothetical protein
MAANILIIAIMIRIMIIGIQIGLNTHHHDHVIVPMSLRTIKTIASNPQNPIPPLLPEDLLMLSPCELYRAQRSRIHNREVWLLLTLAIAGLNEPAYEKSQDRGRF